MRFNSTRPRFGGRKPHFGSNARPNKLSGKFFSPEVFVNKMIEVIAEEEFIPKHQFSDFAIEQTMKDAIDARGYTLPSPIQDQAIPQALLGKDVLGIANTGTGKTAAFLIPLINKILQSRSEKVLVLAPTRELATQIQDELRSFTPRMGIYSVLCIGGASMNVQIQNLRRSYSFVIATPGRLKDLVDQRCINLSQFHNVVLDEVDHMFDMGFIRDVQYILSKLPETRQSLFFSATLSKDVDRLVKEQLHNPVIISLKKRETAASVDQDIVRVGQGSKKIEVLHDLLIQADFTKVLIFGRTKRGVHNLSRMLDERGFKVDAIHGDKTQNARQQALDKFKKDKITILVATDVAARGIDIPDVSHVINYEIPETYEDYIHRIGRTGRADKLGKALTFVE